ncbi:MAG: hypothetical protein ACTS3F_02895 [Phycisphaerales bacterium]
MPRRGSLTSLQFGRSGPGRVGLWCAAIAASMLGSGIDAAAREQEPLMRASTPVSAHRAPLNRVAASAADARVVQQDLWVRYYPLSTGLWAGIPSNALPSLALSGSPGQVVDVRFSMGRPAGASDDPQIRALWSARHPAVDHGALAGIVLNATDPDVPSSSSVNPLLASAPVYSLATASVSVPAGTPVSASLGETGYGAGHWGSGAMPAGGGALAVARARAHSGAVSDDQRPVPHDSMERQSYRALRLREIAAGCSGERAPGSGAGPR